MRARRNTIQVSALSNLGTSSEDTAGSVVAGSEVVAVVVTVSVSVNGSVNVCPLSAVETKENKKQNNRHSKQNVIKHLLFLNIGIFIESGHKLNIISIGNRNDL